MEQKEIYQLFRQVEAGALSAEEAMRNVDLQPEMLVGNYEDIDLYRSIRQGMPEVIYGEGKTAEQILGIASAMKERKTDNIMITRLSQEKADWVGERLELEYDAVARIGIVGRKEVSKLGKIAVVAAGTSDMPVAEEAAVTA